MATKREELGHVLTTLMPIEHPEFEYTLGQLVLRQEGGCFAKASPDEPLFILRAQDSIAPHLIRMWAETLERMTEVHLALKWQDRMDERERIYAKINEARAIADAMDAWPGRRTPD